MSNKVIFCRCEDVTLYDVEQAISQGYYDIEEVKRFTGLGTGPCQGKECMVAACKVLLAARNLDPTQRERQPEAPSSPHPFTLRPPVYSVPLGLLARSREQRKP